MGPFSRVLIGRRLRFTLLFSHFSPSDFVTEQLQVNKPSIKCLPYIPSRNFCAWGDWGVQSSLFVTLEDEVYCTEMEFVRDAIKDFLSQFPFVIEFIGSKRNLLFEIAPMSPFPISKLKMHFRQNKTSRNTLNVNGYKILVIRKTSQVFNN